MLSEPPAMETTIDREGADRRSAAPAKSAWMLLGLALLAGGLAIYQWLELETALAGGKLACSVSQTIDCAPVWSSSFARRVHSLTGLPVAGLGFVWSVTAAALAGSFAARLARGRAAPLIQRSLLLVALAGVVAVVVFASVSYSLGVLCPTCLGTYLLVLGFAGLSLRLFEGGSLGLWAKAAGLAAGAALLSYGLAFGPAYALDGGQGRLPPKVEVPAATATPSAAPADPVSVLLRGLSGEQRQIFADLLAQTRQAPVLPRGAHPLRFRLGPPAPAVAPVELVEWTDIKCGHCAEFSLTLKEIMARLPKDTLTVEPRQFPLAQECNPAMQRPDPTGASCAGALALICLEGHDQYFEAQTHLFAEQDSLTPERIEEVVAPHLGGMAALKRCMTSPETKAKLADDTSFAIEREIQGTPLVLMNGREVPAFGPFLHVLFLARGDLNHPAFASLPAPRPH